MSNRWRKQAVPKRAPAMASGLDGARWLRSRGLVPIPLRPPGEESRRKGKTVLTTGKEPLLGNFAERALSSGAEDDERTWTDRPSLGVGLLLGLLPESRPGGDQQPEIEGVVDVEEDDPEAAGAVWERIFRGGVPETLPVRPQVGCSCSRSLPLEFVRVRLKNGLVANFVPRNVHDWDRVVEVSPDELGDRAAMVGPPGEEPGLPFIGKKPANRGFHHPVGTHRRPTGDGSDGRRKDRR